MQLVGKAARGTQATADHRDTTTRKVILHHGEHKVHYASTVRIHSNIACILLVCCRPIMDSETMCKPAT
jgi:hypothetical protein